MYTSGPVYDDNYEIEDVDYESEKDENEVDTDHECETKKEDQNYYDDNDRDDNDKAEEETKPRYVHTCRVCNKQLGHTHFWGIKCSWKIPLED
jgi:hypothetical protein